MQEMGAEDMVLEADEEEAAVLNEPETEALLISTWHCVPAAFCPAGSSALYRGT